MGLSALFKVQAAVEVTYGTAVTTATSKWYQDAMFGFRDEQAYAQPMERRGSFARGRRSYQTSNRIVSNTFKQDITFEDAPFLLGMALKEAAITGAGDPYTYTFTPSTVAANTPKSYSLQYGDDVQAFIAAGCLAKSLKISAKENEAAKIEAELFAKSIATATFTNSLSDRAVESVLANKFVLYMDDTGGTIGSTQKASTLIDWAWSIPEHFYPKFYQDGALTLSTFGEKMFQPELEMTVAFNAAVNTLRTKYTAGTRQLVRLAASGASHTFTIDGAYILEEDILILDERDGGETIAKLKIKGEYDSTDALYCSVVVTNALSALP